MLVATAATALVLAFTAGFQLFCCGGTFGNQFYRKSQVHACQRMIRVNADLGIRHIYDRDNCRLVAGAEAKSVADLDVLIRKLFDRHIDDPFGVVFAVRVFGCYGQLLFIPDFESGQLGFQAGDDLAGAGDEG